MSESPYIRVSTADRERAMAELARHFGTGRLSLAEFDARSIQVLHAESRDQLADLFTDLPGPPGQEPQHEPRAGRRGLLVRAVAALVVGLAFWFTLGSDMWLPLVGCILVVSVIWIATS